MKYFYIEPEVAGGWAQNSSFDRVPGRPPGVYHLHYQFDGWLGDEILESTPFFIASERLAQGIEEANLTGVKFDDVEVSTSEQFQELYPGLQLPKFRWLKVEGKVGRDDFGTATDGRLVVSEIALSLLQKFAISQALVADFQK